MVGNLNILLRLTIWFLLTADLSIANILIGIAVAFLLPRGIPRPSNLKQWLHVLGEVVVAIPQAYKEALEIMIFPHNHEVVTVDRAKQQRTPSLLFLDIFLITFTPKTIVQRYREQGWYEVHRVTRRPNP